MEIVPTSNPKKINNGLEVLILRKAVLKEQIDEQKKVITQKTQVLLSPTSFTTFMFHFITKGITVVDGFIVGYKVLKSIRTLYHKFKKTAK